MDCMMKLHCGNCGHEFECCFGIGYGTLYCDRYGKAVSVDFATNSFFDENCHCGGRYTATAMDTFPQCGQLLAKSDGKEVGHWE